MSVAVQYDLDADQGSTIPVSVGVTEADGSDSDLSGFTGQMQVRLTPEDDTILAEGTVAIVGNVVTGTVAAADTEDALWRAASYDLRIMSGTTREYLARGIIRLRPTVTR